MRGAPAQRFTSQGLRRFRARVARGVARSSHRFLFQWYYRTKLFQTHSSPLLFLCGGARAETLDRLTEEAHGNNPELRVLEQSVASARGGVMSGEDVPESGVERRTRSSMNPR